MTEIVVTKTAQGFLIPVDPQGVEYVAKMKLGAGATVTIKRHNNPAFHRKLMALFNVGFEAWEPEQLEYKGQIVAKEFNQFRRDITVLAGYYESSINLRGEVRLTAKSLNFNSMDHDEREALYNAVASVLLQQILRHYKRADLDQVVEQITRFT